MRKVDNSFREEGTPMRRFYLNRLKDETGISRTGRVLEGVLTQSGKVLTEWRPPHSTMGIYNSMAEFMLIHVDCHPSCNEVIWLDDLAGREIPLDEGGCAGGCGELPENCKCERAPSLPEEGGQPRTIVVCSDCVNVSGEIRERQEVVICDLCHFSRQKYGTLTFFRDLTVK